MKRIETGPLEFGDDWPGLFVRGDDIGFILRAVTLCPPPQEKLRAIDFEQRKARWLAMLRAVDAFAAPDPDHPKQKVRSYEIAN